MCDRLKVKTGFTIKDPSTGRKRAFKAGREYWVTTGSYRHGEVVGIAPKGKNMGYAMLFSPTIVDEYFEKME
jgi:hypothetical protein